MHLKSKMKTRRKVQGLKLGAFKLRAIWIQLVQPPPRCTDTWMHEKKKSAGAVDIIIEMLPAAPTAM